MNAGERPVVILLGSNIAPEENIRRAVDLLRAHGRIEQISTTWETRAIGSHGPNFYNTAVLFYTHLPADELKYSVLRPIESRLGRVRTADKNAPRTIDLDIEVDSGQVIDPHLWERPFLILTVAELLPDLPLPETGETLAAAAQRILKSTWAVPHPEYNP